MGGGLPDRVPWRSRVGTWFRQVTTWMFQLSPTITSMPRRSYDQYCPLARALDVVGERWTVLIVRELLAGPRRYTDLHADLPGVSTDVLASRLKEMENDGLVTRRRRLPSTSSPPVAGTCCPR